MWSTSKQTMVAPEQALPGRDQPLEVPDTHYVTGRRIKPPFPENTDRALFAMGCFWGPERRFWQMDGVYSTAVGYAGGYTRNPTYEEVCSGMTGHAEVVLVVYEPAVVSYARLLTAFWEGHDPTQGMRQGNDLGTQYRSAVYAFDDAQLELARTMMAAYAERLAANGFGGITTEVLPAPKFYYAEDYHQQYLAKNPGGYCGMGGTGVRCDVS